MGTADNVLLKNSVRGFRKKTQVRQQAGNLHHQRRQGGSCKAQRGTGSGKQPHSQISEVAGRRKFLQEHTGACDEFVKLRISLRAVSLKKENRNKTKSFNELIGLTTVLFPNLSI